MKNIYITLNNYLNKNKLYHSIIKFLEKYTTYGVVILYGLVLLYDILYRPSILLSVTLKPLIGLIIVSLIRMFINRPRPFDKYPITPIIHHESNRSFPSRHTFSAFIIGLTILPYHIIVGTIILLLGILIGLSRILGGIHYISDVLFAIVLAFIINYIPLS